MQEHSFVEHLELPQPCGFDFDRVFVDSHVTTYDSSGNPSKYKATVLLNGNNLEKVKLDIYVLSSAVHFPSIIDGSYKPLGGWLEALNDFSAPGDLCGYTLNANLTIQPPTATGKVPLYPITATVDLVNGDKALICNLDYLANGDIGKARIIRWDGENGVMTTIVGKNGLPSIKDIKVNDGQSGWVKIS